MEQLGTADAGRSRPLTSEELTGKLEAILRDRELNLELSPYLMDMIIPAKVAQGRLTNEQAQHLLEVSRQTMATPFSPKVEERAAREAERYLEREPISDFARW